MGGGSLTVPTWVWYVLLVVVPVVLVASADDAEALIFVGLAALGRLVQRFGAR